MADIKLDSGRIIGSNHRPYFAAEMNSSHNGNMETAKKMIDAAADCGCDAVKFQSWSAESLYSADYYKQNPIAKRMVEKFALNENMLEELADHCQRRNISFSSTPYSRSEVDFLVKVKADYIKVASMDLNNLPFLNYIGEKRIPIVLSTGMGTIEEIHQAVKAIEQTGNRKICILHCVSEYPVSIENANVNNIQMLRKEFPEYPIGYSDHTMGAEAAHAAIALGAVMLEKHFTLDNSKIGWDNQMACEPAAMKRIIEGCLGVYSSLGAFERILSSGELEQKEKMRRSIVANKELFKGHAITIADIDAKRPGEGIPPEAYEKIIGKRLKREIGKDELIREDVLYD